VLFGLKTHQTTDGEDMPEYLKFESKLADLNYDQVEEQLRQKMELVREALSRLEENDRLSPSTLERTVSV
jgi:hypothetical protein